MQVQLLNDKEIACAIGNMSDVEESRKEHGDDYVIHKTKTKAQGGDVFFHLQTPIDLHFNPFDRLLKVKFRAKAVSLANTLWDVSKKS